MSLLPPSPDKGLGGFPTLCGMKPDSQRQPCTLGARRGHFNLRQQQRSWSCSRRSPPGRQMRGGGRGGEASLWRGSVGYQLSVEPGSCARPCRHRTGDELVWVSIGCLCASPAPPLALPCPAPPLVQISVLKGRVPPTSPHGPPPPLHQESSLP